MMTANDPTLFLIDALGWLGAVLYLLAYFLFSTKRLPGDSYTYQTMNLLGGVLLVVNAIYFRAYPSVGVNLVWGLITVLAMVRKYREGGGSR